MVDLPDTLSGQLLLGATMMKQALAVAVLRYLLMALPAFVLCYLLAGRVLRLRPIQPNVPVPTRQILRELAWSLSSCTIFAVMDVAVVLLSVAGVMQARVLDSTPAWPEFVGTVVALVLVHDTYFYWAHRLMHWRPIYHLAHATHHRSTRPTPFAAFAFHPVEAVIEYAFVPLIALVAPVHVMPLLVFGLVMTAMNVYAHLGVELMRRGFARRSPTRFLLTATHHDLHHTTPRYDFAFYFNVWDRLMGTLHPDYEAVLDEVSSRR